MSEAVESIATEVADGEVTESVERSIVPAVPALAVTPVVKATELVARLATIREASEKAMKDGVDFGRVPGTDKPTLFKPGAEKLSVLFQLDVQLDNEKIWGPGEHLTVLSHATVYHAPSGARLGYGEGLCTTRERKYAYRKQERTCPACGAAAVIKGKAEFGGGWLCWKKRDGCGAKFADGDEAIESQEVGEIDNPDLPDLWNTAVKMAEKRARVDAVLAVTGASALFTQDVEDQAAPDAEVVPAPSADTAATTSQKRAITTILNKAGVAKDFQREIVHKIAGNPPTKAGATTILDTLKVEGRTPEDGVEELLKLAGIDWPSDIPAPDEADLPPADQPVGEAGEEIKF